MRVFLINSHGPVKREQELHESCLDITAREAKLNSHQLSLKFESVQSCGEWIRVGVKRERELHHQLSSTYSWFKF